VSVDAFSLHNFRGRNTYTDEMSCFYLGWGGGRYYELVWPLFNEVSCWLPNVLVDGVM
jgi:hypothetical protein